MITVIIPLYNKEKTIRRSLDSVLNQSTYGFEIIVVNDGSTDNGPLIVESYHDDRIKIVHQKNAGVSAARNRGIGEANKSWVAFLDADDEYHPDFLEEVKSCIEKFPEVDTVYCDPMWMQRGVHLNKRTRSDNTPKIIKDYFHHIVFQEGLEINSSCVVIKKEIFSVTGLFPVGILVGEDSDMWIRLAWTAKIAHIPKFLSTYHLDAGDSNWEGSRLKDAHWIHTYHEWLSQGRIPTNLLVSSEYYFQKYILDKALLHTLHGRTAAARDILLHSVKWKVAPKKYGLKVLLYTLLPIFEIRSIFSKSINQCIEK